MFTVTAQTIIHASQERVFSALTRGLNSWWGNQFLDMPDADQFVLELKLGGRFYATTGHNDKEGALLGFVIAIEEPELIRMQGPFGMGTWGGHGTLEVSLKESEADRATTVTLRYIAIGHFETDVKSQYESGWQSLLHSLKALVESRKTLGHFHDPALDIHR